MCDVGLARATQGRRAMLCASAVLALAGGCSLALSTDREQCQSPADCAVILGGPETSYTCEQHLCQAVVECTTTPDCMNKPDRPICGGDGLCVQCVADPDCGTLTAHCVSGMCEDPTWGCLEKADTRPPAAMSTATLRVKTIDALSRGPVSALTARPCHLSSADRECTQRYDGYASDYNPATGETTITGVLTAYGPRPKLVPDPSLGMYNLELLTNRTLREGDTFPVMKLVPKTALEGLAMTLKPPADVTTKGILDIKVHDCTGAMAPGVKIGMVDPPADLITGYNTEAGTPDFGGGLTETTVAGTGGMLNVPVGVTTTVVVTIPPSKTITYQFVPVAGTTTTVDLYPGKFQ